MWHLTGFVPIDIKMLSGFPWLAALYQQESITQICKRVCPFAGEWFVLRLRLICLCLPQSSGAHQPKANVVVPVRRVVVVPIGGTEVLPVVVPRPAAYHPVGARDRSPFSHTIFLRRFVLATLIAAKTLRTRSAAFSSSITF